MPQRASAPTPVPCAKDVKPKSHLFQDCIHKKSEAKPCLGCTPCDDNKLERDVSIQEPLVNNYQHNFFITTRTSYNAIWEGMNIAHLATLLAEVQDLPKSARGWIKCSTLSTWSKVSPGKAKAESQAAWLRFGSCSTSRWQRRSRPIWKNGIAVGSRKAGGVRWSPCSGRWAAALRVTGEAVGQRRGSDGSPHSE